MRPTFVKVGVFAAVWMSNAPPEVTPAVNEWAPVLEVYEPPELTVSRALNVRGPVLPLKVPPLKIVVGPENVRPPVPPRMLPESETTAGTVIAWSPVISDVEAARVT